MNRSWMPTAAGVLNLLAGVMALFGTLCLIFLAIVTTVVPGATVAPDDDLPLMLASWLLWAMAALALISGLISVTGGVVALRRSGWGWPLAGAIAAFFCAMPIGLVALIFVVAAERELRGAAAPTPPAAAA
jgi:hypothetical protein